MILSHFLHQWFWVIIPVSALFALILLNFLRAHPPINPLRSLVLRPNCLLTQAPLVFIPGRQSLFYFLKYWNQVPEFLYEHGYMSEEWPLPWKSIELREQVLQARLLELRDQRRKVHLFTDHVEELEPLWRDFKDVITSITLVSLTSETHGYSHSLVLQKKWSLSPFFWLHKIVLNLHNRFSSSRVDATIVGLATSSVLQNSAAWLDHVIKLAEEEFQR